MGAVTIMLDVYTLISILYGFTYLQNTLMHACCLATSNIIGNMYVHMNSITAYYMYSYCTLYFIIWNHRIVGLGGTLANGRREKVNETTVEKL